ncbi:MAG: ECF transporter S component [Candidatus Izemoplasmataceae bacterium]
MRNKKTLEMTTMAMFIAIIVVMAMIPQVGFFQYGGVAITTLHVPVIIGAIYGGRKFGFTLGLAFGLFSLLIAYLRPGPVDVVFQNPVISILPRALFGLATAYIFIGLSKLIKNEPVAVGITFALGTFTHTVFTLSVLILFQESIQDFLGPLFSFIASVMALNGPIEIALAIIIGTPIVIRLKNSSQFSLD